MAVITSGLVPEEPFPLGQSIGKVWQFEAFCLQTNFPLQTVSQEAAAGAKRLSPPQPIPFQVVSV